ncbi:hypothetical protein MHYP_G00023030 [Metynnis hypsauchen]
MIPDIVAKPFGRGSRQTRTVSLSLSESGAGEFSVGADTLIYTSSDGCAVVRDDFRISDAILTSVNALLQRYPAISALFSHGDLIFTDGKMTLS